MEIVIGKYKKLAGKFHDIGAYFLISEDELKILLLCGPDKCKLSDIILYKLRGMNLLSEKVDYEWGCSFYINSVKMFCKSHFRVCTLKIRSFQDAIDNVSIFKNQIDNYIARQKVTVPDDFIIEIVDYP